MEKEEKGESSKATEREKKQYFDKNFKKQLTKALEVNKGEPGNIEKIRGNRYLQKYQPERIVEFLNNTSSEIQKNFDSQQDSEADSNIQDVVKLTNFLNTILDEDKKSNDELKLVLKLQSESHRRNQTSKETEKVDFVALNKFLYTAVSGNPDVSNLNEPTLAVLSDTLKMLNEQVDEIVKSEEFVEDLKSNLFYHRNNDDTTELAQLSRIFNDDAKLNPLSLPFECLLNQNENSKENDEED